MKNTETSGTQVPLECGHLFDALLQKLPAEESLAILDSLATGLQPVLRGILIDSTTQVMLNALYRQDIDAEQMQVLRIQATAICSLLNRMTVHCNQYTQNRHPIQDAIKARMREGAPTPNATESAKQPADLTGIDTVS